MTEPRLIQNFVGYRAIIVTDAKSAMLQLEVNLVKLGLVGQSPVRGVGYERLPSINLRMTIWPDAVSAQNSMAAVSANGGTVWVLMQRLNSSCSRSMRWVVLALFHWLGSSRVKVNSCRRPPRVKSRPNTTPLENRVSH